MLHSAHPYLHFLRLWLTVLALLAAGSAHAAFTDHGDGTVSDAATGLMWDKCTWGQAGVTDCASNGNAGNGYGVSAPTWPQALALAATANAANHKGHNDWRLPNRLELESLVKIDAVSPAIDTTAFPNTPSYWYWSSTIYTPDPAYAWGVDFYYGYAYAYFQSDYYHVRLVRSGQSFDTFDALAPAVSAISPTSGSTLGGTAVTISGTQFTGASAVSIGGVAATGLSVVNDTTITATTPAGTAGAKNVVVTAPEGSGTGSGLFTYSASAPTYTVTFDNNGGTGSMSAQSASVATHLTANSFTRSGYTFSGWNTVAGGSGTPYANSASYAFVADVTLYAQWTAINYSVSFNANGGSAVSSQSVAYNGTASAPTAPSKTGSTFAGWYSDSGLTTAFSFATLISADTTLYAQWTINNYSVSFSSNGGSAVASQSIAYNTVATAPTAPTQTGYTFAGWYSDSGLTTAFSFATLISADTTLYAQWTINNYTVSFSSNGGSAVASQSIAYNGTASAPSAPTQTGYTFAGWYSDSGLTTAFSFATLITADTTLYAKWTPDYSKIANNGSELPADASLGSAPSDWACTRDNATGLTWEVKTSSGLRSQDNTYSNYDDLTQAEFDTGSAWRNPTQAEIDAAGNSIGFVNAVNVGALCGFNDWKMPSKDELLALYPKIDANTSFFPNSPAEWFWSGSPSAPDPAGAWVVYFVNGGAGADYQSHDGHVRLVHSGQVIGTFALTLSASGAGSGTLTGSAGSLNCNGTAGTTSGACTASLSEGTSVDLTATAASGSNFTGWSGACAGSSSPCTLIMAALKSVTAHFSLNNYTVSFTSNGGSVVANQTVAYNGTASVPTAPTKTGSTFAGWYSDSGLTTAFSFTTAIVADTTLYAQWTALCGSANGVATAFAPAAADLCAGGSTASAVTAASPWAWTCTAGGDTAVCSAPNATLSGGGVGQALVSGGAWAVNPAQSAGFIPASGHAQSPPSLPADVSFAQGLFAFTLTGTVGSTATVAITFPNAFPAGTQYWKYGKTLATPSAHWYVFSGAVFAGNTVTLTLTDGGAGDDDLTQNGTIVDPGGPGLYNPPSPENDTTPDPFSFVDVLNQALGTAIESNTITVSGIDSGAYLSIVGGEYRIGSGVWNSGAGWVYNGQTVTLRHTTAATSGASVNTTLTIGGVSDTFSSTTLNKKPPVLASVPAQSGLLGVAFSLALAPYVTPTDGDPIVSYALASGSLPPGVSLNSTSGMLSGTPTTAGLYTAGVTANDRDGASNAVALSFTIDSTTPAPFAFSPQNDVPRSTVATSNAITVKGLTLPVPISVSNGRYSLNGAAFTALAGTVSNGASVTLQLTSAASHASTATALVSIGRGSGNFTVSTHAAGRPDAFTFTPVFAAALSTLYTSNSVTLTGFDGQLALSVSGGEYALNGGAYSATAGNVSAGDTLMLRGRSSEQRGGRTSVVLTVGETSGSFNIGTKGGFMPWLPVLLD